MKDFLATFSKAWAQTWPPEARFHGTAAGGSFYQKAPKKTVSPTGPLTLPWEKLAIQGYTPWLPEAMFFQRTDTIF